jgi:CheY-like chemotaxis protein
MGIQSALVVDDSPSARYILQRLLERQHIQVHLADSAQQALAYLREHRPDVVFMDDMMPDMAGQEAVDRLGADPHTASIPIIMYTGSDYAANAPSTPRRGVIGVLCKPFTQSDVDALLAKLATRVPQARSEPARLVRLPEENPAVPAAAVPPHDPVHTSRPGQFAEELKLETRLAVEQLLGERLETQVDERIEYHTAAWHQALEHARNEHTRAQSQLLDERLPRLLELLEQRLEDRLESHTAELEQRWQKHLEEENQTPGIGPLQRAQIARIVHSEIATAVDRPARQSARRVAAELIRGDLNALGLRLDRLRRRFNRVVVAAVVAVIAAGVGGYLVGVVGFGG